LRQVYIPEASGWSLLWLWILKLLEFCSTGMSQCRLVVSYQHFGTTYQSCLQGQAVQEECGDHQPTKELTKGRDSHRAQVDIPWSLESFLH
jgi:hypothetical protein